MANFAVANCQRSAAHWNAHYAEQGVWRGRQWGRWLRGRVGVTNEIAGNAQNANEMCNHPGMQHNAKCVNILLQLQPLSLRPLRYMSEMSCGPCPCALSLPLSAMWHVQLRLRLRLLYKFRIYCQ